MNQNNSLNERLNKRLALLLGVSRREADNLIEAGRVFVNGKIATLGNKVDLADEIEVDHKKISGQSTYKYYIFNKPRGYVCSRRDQGESPTIYKLLPNEMHVYKPVGRLDKDSSGLLLLTNDGDFAHRMTHPKFQKNKIYEVSLDKPLQPLHHQMIVDYGIHLEDGVSKFYLEKIDDKGIKWRVSMQEGRNRQIRRTFKALGYEVKTLHRTNFGPYTLNDLQSGKYSEVAKL